MRSSLGNIPDDLARRILESADKPAAQANTLKPKKPRVAKLATASWCVTLCVPCQVVSEMNKRDHWTERRNRFATQAHTVMAAWYNSPIGTGHWNWSPRLPITITLTHLGRKMDSDNLAGAFKGVRDQIARILAIDDGDDRLTWQYDQRIATPGIEIRIEPRRT